MHHLVNVSIAPVIVVMDDTGNPLQLLALSRSFVLWLPAWLYAWLSGAPAAGTWLSAYARGWAADLALMAEAALMLLIPDRGGLGRVWEITRFLYSKIPNQHQSPLIR